MKATTNFDEWLDAIALDGYEDIYALFHAVQDHQGGECEWGRFQTTWARGSTTQRIVTCADCELALRLASEEARDGFLKCIAAQNFPGEEIEGWYYYHHAMEKDD